MVWWVWRLIHIALAWWTNRWGEVGIDLDPGESLGQVDQSSREVEEGNVESQDLDRNLQVEEAESRDHTEEVDNSQKIGAGDDQEEGRDAHRGGLEVDPEVGQVWRNSAQKVSAALGSICMQ